MKPTPQLAKIYRDTFFERLKADPERYAAYLAKVKVRNENAKRKQIEKLFKKAA